MAPGAASRGIARQHQHSLSVTGTSPKPELNASPHAPASHKIIVKLHFLIKPPLSWVILKSVQKLSPILFTSAWKRWVHIILSGGAVTERSVTGAGAVQTRSSSCFAPLTRERMGTTRSCCTAANICLTRHSPKSFFGKTVGNFFQPYS